MAASQYQRDRKHIYQRGEQRGKDYAKRAFKRLDKECGLRHIKHGGRVVEIQLDDDEMSCRKKAFKTLEIALDSLDQINLFAGAHTKPKRTYQCLHCSLWHLTHLSKTTSNVDGAGESC